MVTEKLDGGNCSIFRGKVFARTASTEATHQSFGPIKQLASQVGEGLEVASVCVCVYVCVCVCVCVCVYVCVLACRFVVWQSTSLPPLLVLLISKAVYNFTL